MNVLIATGKRELDEFFVQFTNTPIPPIAYKEGVLTLSERYKPNVVILSAFLDGSMDNKDVLYELRKQGAQVIMLIGTTDPEEIRKNWMPLGVYDYITDPVTEEKIRLALEYPATLGMAEERLKQIEQGKINESDESNDEQTKSHRIWRRRKKKKENIIQSKSKKEQSHTGKINLKHDQGNTQWAFEQHSTDYKENDAMQPKEYNSNVSEYEWQISNDQYKKDFFSPKENNEAIEQNNDKNERKENKDLQSKILTSVWNFQQQEPIQSVSLPEGYNIVVTSPVSAGKTYVAINLASVLSKQGLNTELVTFDDYDDVWQYLDMPSGKQGSPNGLPNLTVSLFEKMINNAHYRVIDLPYEKWANAELWYDALFLYVTDMDVVHQRSAEREIEKFQGYKVLRVLNRFVSNILNSGQEQKLRLNADIILNDQPTHYLAMRFGRPVITTDQEVAREFEIATKTVQEALPQTGQNNLFSINQSS